MQEFQEGQAAQVFREACERGAATGVQNPQSSQGRDTIWELYQ